MAKPSFPYKNSKEALALKELRTAYQWSTRDLAKEWYVTNAAIVQWEGGKNKIPGLALKLMEIYIERLNRKRGQMKV